MKHVRGIIIDKKSILLVHRIKDNKEYFTIPGGTVETNENELQALKREIKEETNLEIITSALFINHYNEYFQEEETYYLITRFTGTPSLGSPEKERHCKINQYCLEWHKIENLKDIPLLPDLIKNKILLKTNRSTSK
ncbi:MAG: NUDIX domain-containing protein [bacterium]|nr:NUDIX domain-containing protein [bacterium]